MPFKSDAQRRWAHTPAGRKALGGSAKVAEWDQASKGRSLPARATKKKKGRTALARTDVVAPARMI
jgi:hypothetical protein